MGYRRVKRKNRERAEKIARNMATVRAVRILWKLKLICDRPEFSRVIRYYKGYKV